jgi:hypothetical protein
MREGTRGEICSVTRKEEEEATQWIPQKMSDKIE